MLSYKRRDGAIPVANTTLSSLFDESRERNVNAEFLFLETNQRVYLPDVWPKLDQYAKGLLSLGLKRGDTLTLIACVSAEALYIAAAAISIGVGFSHPYVYIPKGQSITTLLPLVEPKVLIVGEGMQGTTLDALQELLESNSERFPYISKMYYDGTGHNRTGVHSKLAPLSELTKLGEATSHNDLMIARKAVQPSDAAMHFFSSGTTGKPKCIVHSQYSIANEITSQTAKDLGNIIVTSNNLDELCGYAGVTLGLAGYISKVIVGMDFNDETITEDLRRMAETLTSEKVDHVVMTSAFSGSFLSLAMNGTLEYPTVKTVLLSGQVFSEKLKRNIIEYMGALPWTLYGMSEMLNMAIVSFEDTDKAKEQRIKGKMLPTYNTEIKLIDDDGNITPIGTPSQICTKKYSRLIEYKNSDSCEELFDTDGFIKTGDIGVMDENGAIEIHGRHVDAVRFKVMAEVAYPGPIEVTLCKHPSIRDAQVVSATTNDWVGDELTYCLILNEGCEKPSKEEIIEHVSHEMDSIKLPYRIFYFEKFPRTTNSRKVSKALIKKQIHDWLSLDKDVGLTSVYKMVHEASKSSAEYTLLSTIFDAE